MQEKRYNETKKEIRSVLLTYQKGASLNEFLKSYKELLGERLPSHILGFRSDIAFLRSMPDVVHVSSSNDGRIQLFGIADETSEHIQKLVSKQRSTSKTNNKSFKSSSNFTSRKTISNVTKNPTFVPGALRAEILKLILMYPDGIALPAFVLAYRKQFNKYLSLEKGLDTLENIINAMPELEIKEVNFEKKIHVKNIQTLNYISNEVTGTENGYPVKTEGGKSILSEVLHAINSSKFDKSGISEAVKKNFEMVLERCPDGILDVHFPPIYEKMTGKPFDLLELGYNSILELVDVLPSIFKRAVDPYNEKNWIILPANAQVINKEKGKQSPSEGSCASIPEKLSSLNICDGIPAGAASPSLTYKPPVMPENINLDEYLPIFVSAIVNPSLFWFQLQTDDAIKEFEELENDLELFYNSYAALQYKMNPIHIASGASCVVQCPEDKQWYRAVIKSIPTVEHVNVLFVDYGSRGNISRTVLRYVKQTFFQHPAYAFRAELAGLKPSKNASAWDIRCQQRFNKLCESASIMAFLKPTAYDSFSAYLCDTNGEEDLHLNDALIKEGFAEFCYDSEFIRRDRDTKQQIHNDTTNGINKNIEENYTSKFECQDETSKFNSPSNVLENSPLIQSNKGNLREISNNKAINRRLSFSPDNASESEILCENEYYCKRYLKKVELCEETKFFVINVNDKPYISGGDLTKLFWNDKNHNFLAERLNYKDVVVPTIEILKEDSFDLYQQCKWYKIPDFENLEMNISSLILYPLEWAFKILNIFGHPSVCIRLAIKHEIKTFDPADPLWKEFHYVEENLDNTEKEIEAKLSKLCLYDLKAKSEALKVKRLKLLKMECSGACDEIRRIECLQRAIDRRMAQISSICSRYASCS